MHLVAQLLYLVVFVFVILLLIRLVLDWVQFFAREWRPRGVALVTPFGRAVAASQASVAVAS